MTIKIQNQIKNTKNYYNYLKENSYWIKELSRNDNSINNFIDFLKDKYSLRLSDRVNNTFENIELINKFLNVLK